jgi:virulence-associated protein VapD
MIKKLTESSNMANLLFRKSVRDIRAFRVEDWSDFTALFKEDETHNP